MISAREETWRYLSDRFPSLCFFFSSVIVSFHFASSSRQSALPLLDFFLIHFGPYGRYIGSSQGSFFILFGFRVFCFSGSVQLIIAYILVETGFPIHYR